MKSSNSIVKSIWMAFLVCPIASSLEIPQFHVSTLSGFEEESLCSKTDVIDEMAVFSLGQSKESFFDAFQEWLYGTIVNENNLLNRFLAQVLAEPSESESSVSLRRFLSEDKWAAFNLLFKDAVLHLPNATLTKTILFDLVLGVVNPTCYNISIGDIVFAVNQTSSRQLNMTVSISGLDLTCYSDYNYGYGVIKGTGSADVYTDNNSADTVVSFTTSASSFDVAPPDQVNTQVLNVNIQITNLNFHGGFVASILDTFKSLFKNFFAQQLENVARNQLGSLGSGFLENLVNATQKRIAPLLVPLPSNASNPLQIEHDFLASNSSVSGLLKFRDYGDNAIASFVATLLDQVNQTLVQTVPDPLSPTGTGQDLGINKFLRENVLDKSRTLTILMSQLPVQIINPVLFSSDDVISNSKVILEGFTIFGLDTFRKFNPLVPIGNYTLQNTFQLETLRLAAMFTVEMKPSDLPNAILTGSNPNVAIRENITVTFGLDKLNIALSLFMLFREKALLDIELGSILQPENLVSGVKAIIQDLKVSELSVSVANMVDPTLSGFVSPGIDYIITTAVNAVFRMYKPTFVKAINQFSQTFGRNLLQGQVGSAIGQLPSMNASSVSPLKGSGFVDFRDLLLAPDQSMNLGGSGARQYGDIIRLAVNILNDKILKVDPATGLSLINSILISKFTGAQSNVSGRLAFDRDLVSFGNRIQLGGMDLQIAFRAYNAFINNLDTVGAPMSLLNPVLNQPSHLNNTATMGVGKQLELGTRLYLSLKGSGQEIEDELEISITMQKILVVLEALLRLSEQRFFSFPLRDLFSFDCLLSMIPAPHLDASGARAQNEDRSAGLVNLAISVALMKLNITCAGKCSPAISELTSLLSTPAAANSSTEVANQVLSYVTKLLGGNSLQVPIDRMIYRAHMNCPSSPLYVPNAVPLSFEPFQVSTTPESSFLVMLLISAACVFVTVAAVMLAVKTFVRYRHRRWLRLLPQRDLELVLKEQTIAQMKAASINETTTSMFQSPEIPLWVRLVMPLIIVGNLAFFLSGHLSLGATVNIVATLGGSTIRIDKFYEFSIMMSTMDIWNAGGKALALMIIIFSIIWPYTKQSITLALWFLPPRRLSVSTRGSFLVWLDLLAKWSIVDIMTLIVTVAAFRVSIQSPNVGFLPPGLYSLDLIVVPLWGLYANLIAQLISQISSHFILFFHRRIETRARLRVDQSYEFKVSRSIELSSPEMEQPSNCISSEALHEDRNDKLCSHSFIRPHRGDAERLRVRRAINPMVILLCVIMSVLIVAGCVLPSFSVRILGFVGVLVSSGHHFADAYTEHNLFTIINLMREQADFTGRVADQVGLGSLSALLVISVLVVPIAQAVVLVYMWYSQMTVRRRKIFTTVIEILQAWQYVEVYILSIVIAAWQIGPVSEFMINSYCDTLGNAFASLAYYGILREEDAQCFRVEAYVDNGSYVLAAGAILLALLHTFVMKAVIQYFRDLDYKSPDQKSLKEQDERDSAEDAAARESLARQIHPVPVLFSDTFRWCLVSGNSVVVGVSTMDSESQESNSRDQLSEVEDQRVEVSTLSQSVRLPRDDMWAEQSAEHLVSAAEDESSYGGNWSYSGDSNVVSNGPIRSQTQNETRPDADESVLDGDSFLDEIKRHNI